MTEKRYEKRMNFNINLPSNRCFKSDEAIVDKKEDKYGALSINTIVDLLNHLHEEKETLLHIIDWCLTHHREVGHIVFDSRDEFFIWLKEKGVLK